MATTLTLDGDWELVYFPEGERDVRDPAALAATGAPRIGATVPGNVELDLVRAGLLPDPFVGANIWELQKYERHVWWYTRTFTSPAVAAGDRAHLTFHGLDCFATVWVNGVIVGSSANMLIAHTFDVTGALRPGGPNRVDVRLRSAVLAAREIDYPAAAYAMVTNYEQLAVRKAPHGYGWDITPRAVSAGIWRSVVLEVLPPSRIRTVYYYTRDIDYRPTGFGQEGAGTSRGERQALLGVHWQLDVAARDLEGWSLRFRGVSGSSVFEHVVPVRFTAGIAEITVPEARLWWPKGYGEAALYEVTAELLRDGGVVDTRAERIGLRQVALERTEVTGGSVAGQFLVRCNGLPILCKGTNWVPLDAFHSRDAGRYAAALALLGDIGCNIVRCWGGNVYEDHAFFDYCDAEGILVWQDFAFACALYPQDAAFHEQVRVEAVAVVRKLRNHPSLAIWAGDNEIDIFAAMMGRDPGVNAISRQVLPAVTAAEDPGRVYLPSSPYVSPEAYRGGAADQRNMPEQHLWGPRDYYKSRYYTESTAHFASEMGYHGCPNASSVDRFITPGHRWPWRDNPEWRVHAADQVPEGGPYAGRIKLMADQVRELFGSIPDNLEEFALASQVSQAEAKKFFIEMFRLAKWRRTGIIWWNLLDCWPQFSDAVVDYYYAKKLAYWYIRRSQKPVLLMVGEPEDWRCRLVVGNDSPIEASGVWRVTDADGGATLVKGSYRVEANGSAEVGSLPVSHSDRRLLLLHWSVEGVEQGSHYLLGKPPFSLPRYREWIRAIAMLPDGFDAGAVAR